MPANLSQEGGIVPIWQGHGMRGRRERGGGARFHLGLSGSGDSGILGGVTDPGHLGETLPGGFRVTGVGPSRGGAVVLDAVSPDLAPVRALAWKVTEPLRVDPGLAWQRASRYAAGIPNLCVPSGAHLWSSQGYTWVVLAYCVPEGHVLDRLAQGRLSLDDLTRLLRSLARTLGGLHDQGIAHGHVRPELIWSGVHGTELGGYGVAQVALELAGPAFASTLLPEPYRAPELVAGLARPSPAADVFALGALTQELVASVECQPDPAGEVLLAHATAKDPASRPRSLAIWVEELVGHLLAPASEAQHEAKSSPGESSQGAEPAASRDPTPPFTPPLTHDTKSPAGGALIGSRRTELLEVLTGEREYGGLPSQPEPGEGALPPPPLASPQGPRTRRPAVVSSLVLLLGGALLMAGVVAASFLWTRELPPPIVPVPSSGSSPPPSLASSPAPQPSSPEPALSQPPGARVLPQHAQALLPVDARVPVNGHALALATAVVFGDLIRPETRETLLTLLRLQARWGRELRLVWLHRPVQHQGLPLEIARIGAAIHLEGGDPAFWRFATLLAESQVNDEEAVWQRVRDVGLDEQKVAGRRMTEAVRSRIEADRALAVLLAVRESPTLFVSGKRLEGRLPAPELESALTEQRRHAVELLAAGVPPPELYGVQTKQNLLGLGPEIAARRCPDLTAAPSRGAKDPLVTLVAFLDFESRSCRQLAPTLKYALEAYPDELRIVWKDFPLARHTRARLLAGFAREAGLRAGPDGFWAVHDAFFKAVAPPDDASLLGIATAQRLPGAELLMAAKEGRHEGVIVADEREAERLGVLGAPTLFINGHRLEGVLPRPELLRILRSELAAARRLAAAGVAPARITMELCGDEARPHPAGSARASSSRRWPPG